MRGILHRLGIGGFIIAINLALVAAAVAPAPESARPALDVAVFASIAVLFFLYGARIAPADAYDGIVHWKLHLTTLTFTFVVFPVIGLVLALAPGFVLDERLYPGFLFLCLVPSTVQASVGFTALAGGNVPGAIASASTSNILGVFLTPTLALALMTTTGHTPVHGRAVLTILLEILLPFALGQLARRWLGDLVAQHPQVVRNVGRSSIVLVIYTAFSGGERDHVWQLVTWWGVLQLVVLSVVVVAGMLWLTRTVAQRLDFPADDVLAIQFCGTKKALITGLPMASVLFPRHFVDLVVLPLMVFHHVQLIMCAWLARRYAHTKAVARLLS